MDDLALEVGLVHLGDAEGADSGGRQVEQSGAAETAGADHEHLRVLQALLAGHPDVGDDQVPAVPSDLVDRELVGWLDQCWQGHGHSSGMSGGCSSYSETPRPPSMFPARGTAAPAG